MKKYFFLVLLTIAGATNTFAKDHLRACQAKQADPLQGRYITFNYTDLDHRLTHNFQPWKTTLYNTAGTIWCSTSELMRSDTLFMWDTSYSKTLLNKDELLYQHYRQTKLYDVTRDMFEDELVAEAHYTPIPLINYFCTHRDKVAHVRNREFAVYSTTINKAIVKLFIRKKGDLLMRVTIMNNRDVYGDVTAAINYTDYKQVDGVPYAAHINISDYDGIIGDTVALTGVSLMKTVSPLLTKPAGYVMKEKEEIRPDLTVDKYNDHIYFINLNHTNGRAMLAVFDSFVLVAESPLNSDNGERIINEVRKIAPGKPIRYFVFSHYHPDYTGGIRPFIYRDATVLCSQSDSAYVAYVANAPHTLQPDSLQLYPKQLHLTFVGEHMSVGDGKYTMDIYFIGKKSAHTSDYLIYYFPKEKMLFEGDLVSIQKEGKIYKADKRQVGLYNAIKELNLDVQNVEQSWPLTYGYKTSIPFKDMEEAMSVK